LKTLILNFKNYSSIQGKGSLKLARAAERVAKEVRATIIVAPPTPLLGLVASKVGIEVFGQSVGSSIGEKTTGSVLPEAIKAAGASGTILNHSEARLRSSEIPMMVQRLKRLGLKTCLCARDSKEVASMASLGTEYLAVEPPALIGSGVAVSKAQPRLVESSVRGARGAGYRGKILCGAGIVDGRDVKRAVELGVDGVLVASSVVAARNWASKIRELSLSLD
jgi:triosephosphate isomerase (TIM)